MKSKHSWVKCARIPGIILQPPDFRQEMETLSRQDFRIGLVEKPAQLYYNIVRVIKDKNKQVNMQKKLTISLDEQIYFGLLQVIGKEKINRFIEDLVRPYVQNLALHEGYQQMAADKEREALADEWVEATFKDGCSETW